MADGDKVLVEDDVDEGSAADSARPSIVEVLVGSGDDVDEGSAAESGGS